jgi:hypothetical protein
VLPALTFKNTPFKYTMNLQLTYTLAVKRYYFVAFGKASQRKDAAGLAGCGRNGTAQETLWTPGLGEMNESMHTVGTDLQKIALQAEYAAFVYYAR